MTAWEAAEAGFVAWLRAAGRSKSTIRLRRHYVRQLAVRFGDPWTVTGDELAGWLAGPEWMPETRKSARSSVRMFYRWAVASGRVAVSPADGLDSVRVPRALPRPASEDVLAAALARANDEDRLMLVLAAYAGLRATEIAAVRPATDVLPDGTLWVRGKGGRERTVPLHPRVADEIEAEQQRRRRGRVGTGFHFGWSRPEVGPEDYLFPGLQGGHVGSDVVGRHLRRVLNGATGHQLRHRFASAAYAADRDLRAVQELLGHASPQTTARYTRVPDGALRSAVEGIQ